MEKQFRCTQFSATTRIFSCFLFRHYSAIARNETAQAEATIGRNSAQRNSDWKPYSSQTIKVIRLIFFLWADLEKLGYDHALQPYTYSLKPFSRGWGRQTPPWGRGCGGAMILAKITSEPQDLHNYLQAPQNGSPSLHDVTKHPAILSPRRAFWSPLVVFIFCLILLA